jgi:hypothetical protein
MLDELQSASVARDLSHDEAPQEDNLLIEAVSLLVQRQRETETWVAEQIDQAESRAAVVKRQYTDLEARLADIEQQLDRLIREFEPARGDAAAGQRLARLREQVEDLKSETDGRPLRSVPPAPLPPVAPPAASAAVVLRTTEAQSAPPRVSTVAAASNATVWDVLGATPQDRFGLLLIFLGVVAVLYAVLTQLRFG